MLNRELKEILQLQTNYLLQDIFIKSQFDLSFYAITISHPLSDSSQFSMLLPLG